MLESLALIIKSGLQPAVVLALAFLVLKNKKSVMQMLAVGCILGIAAMAVLMLSGNRELLDAVISALVLTGALFLFLNNFLKKAFFSIPIFIFATLTVMEGVYKLLLFPREIFIQTTSYLNTELLLVIIGFFSGFLLLLAVACSLIKTGIKNTISWEKFFLYSTLILAVEPLIQLVRYVFVAGLLPLTDLIMAVLVPLINNMFYFSYLIYLIIILFIIGSYRHYQSIKPADTFINPAEARKFRSLKISYKRWTKTVVSLIILTCFILLGDYVLANQKIELSPAQPLTANNGVVSVSLNNTLNDGKLHRFSYTAENDTEIRFIVIHKGSGVYGVGLDACEICGPTGYYQRKDEVVCLNCDVVMSIPTIGFPGGCNPIPLEYEKEENSLIIPVKQLEEKGQVFSK